MCSNPKCSRSCGTVACIPRLLAANPDGVPPSAPNTVCSGNGFELESKGLIHIAGDDARSEFVPTARLKVILEESTRIPARDLL